VLSSEELRERYQRMRAEAGPGVTIVAATKYVPIDDMATLAAAGIDVVGENRAQDLVAKHAVYGGVFRWHFIGQLQSRKAPQVSELCELCHSLASESALRRLSIPALVEVNLSGEPTKSGLAPEELDAFLTLAVDRGVEIRGLMTMPPPALDPEQSRPYFRRLRRLAERFGLAELSMGTSQDWRVAVDEGATYVRIGSALWR
jgi:pyridoxal phosphate enzyme (YggS family)